MKIFNDSLTLRYNTLEKNIKNKTNSFYDSFLDLLEATIKYFLTENNIKYDDSKTLGHLVRNEEDVKEFLLNTLKVDDYTYNKLPDYIKKCNDHKHKKEKILSVESVINYLSVYFSLVNYYLDYKSEDKILFSKDYYISIFGETERLNNEYKLEVLKLKEELRESYEGNKLSVQDNDRYKSLSSLDEIESLNLDDQNQILIMQIDILKDIKQSFLKRLDDIERKQDKTLELLEKREKVIPKQPTHTNVDWKVFLSGAKKEYSWFGKKSEFTQTKKKVLLYSLLTVVVGILATVFAVLGLKFYFLSFFENLWIIAVIFLCVHTLKLKKRMTDNKLKKCSNFDFFLDIDGTWRMTNSEKIRYKWTRRISYFATIINIICLLDAFTINKLFSVLGLIFEISFFILSLLLASENNKLMTLYSLFILYTNKFHKLDENKTFVFDVVNNKTVLIDDLNEVIKNKLIN